MIFSDFSLDWADCTWGDTFEFEDVVGIDGLGEGDGLRFRGFRIPCRGSVRQTIRILWAKTDGIRTCHDFSCIVPYLLDGLIPPLRFEAVLSDDAVFNALY